MNRHQKMLLIWDGASYHRDEINAAAINEGRENDGKSPSECSISCCLFCPYGSQQNSVESISLQAKYFIRRFYELCKTLSRIKKLFQFLLKFKIFTPPTFKKYDAFAPMI